MIKVVLSYPEHEMRTFTCYGNVWEDGDYEVDMKDAMEILEVMKNVNQVTLVGAEYSFEEKSEAFVSYLKFLAGCLK